MAKNVKVWFFILHHTVSVVNLLGQAHRIDLSAHATHLARVLAAVGVGIRKIDRGIAKTADGSKPVFTDSIFKDSKDVPYGEPK
jgi:hypothetical protein